MACFCDKGGLTAIRNVFQDADTLSLPFHLAHLLINIVTQVSCAFFVFEVSKFVCYFKYDNIQVHKSCVLHKVACDLHQHLGELHVLHLMSCV